MFDSTRSDKIFQVINYAFLGFILLIVLYPLVFVLSASLSSPELLLKGEVWLLPKGLSFDSYARVFSNKDILTGYLNTIKYTIIGTAINVLMTIAAAYPLSRRDFVGRGVLTVFMVFTMFFSGGLIPTFILVRDLGMYNSMWALILPSAVSVWNVSIMRTFFQTSVPFEIQEAAMIDGCSNIGILVRIVLPLSLPIILVMIMFYSVSHWNSFFSALIYLTDRAKYPLQVILREILIQDHMGEMIDTFDEGIIRQMLLAEGLKYAVVVVANLPVLMIYPFIQKYFIKGMTLGGLKG
ncbi:MAG: carbohydrate ABC transporter permease [Firmicutes bacterium]|jgi:putative aldouronate transport system permease protein|nr:carbohydrate ABC transporter permease [Bacillota bacterium]